jgi:ribonuclease J
LIENGDVLELDEFGARIIDRHELHKTFIDEESLEEIEYDVIRERKKLAYGGAISLVVTIDRKTHQIVGEPQISFQGVAGIDPTNGFAGSARLAIAEAVAEMKREQIADKAVFKENLRIHLKRFVQKEIRTKPVIVTTIVEV